ncbi:bifunctional glycosyltransferase/CDP-glycerol:glycerophosphate glycerophosphotransferase [Paenibacillus residui]|uniref:CDP-glycerol glycerophosphotransferase family protein n=1 Tax=Paenibacillus residui TaxID=629724 RepID=A0ABW3DB93_9BACL
MDYKISVIIPVYNVEQYISKCLDSVVNQTLGIDNIEVIIVNDCTPDGSMEIVENYAKVYPSIKIVNQVVNQGPGAARNIGLNHVTTEYVSFLDADDFISENTYECILNKFEEHDCEIVLYEYEYYSETNKQYTRNPSAVLYQNNRLVTNILDTPEIIFSGFVCNRVFKHTLFQYLDFPNERMGAFEDTLVATRTSFEAQKIFITNECRYFYRKREDQTNQSRMDGIFDKKELYYNHMEVSLKMKDLCNDYPQYSDLIHWYNARGYTPFIYHMLWKKTFTKQERRELYYHGAQILADVPDQIINRLEQDFTQFLVRKIKKGGYSRYVLAVYSYLFTSKMKKVPNFLKTRFQKLFKGMDLVLILLIANLLKNNRKYQAVWLICERGDDAADNGYHFFKYLRENHPEINAHYLIDFNSKQDYEKIKKFGNIVQFGSIQHKLLFAVSKFAISAHKGKIEPWNYQLFLKLAGRKFGDKKYVFLQHGITKDDVRDILGRENTSFDLFITAAKPEFDYIVKTFGYAPTEVAYTGFPRFDALHDFESKQQILFMPTYRLNVVQPSWLPKSVPDSVFINSEFYARLQSFINNEHLIQTLEKNDYKLVFYPHYEVQQYLKYFSTVSDRVIIANKNEYDVQRLLKESQLLITDFSSVFFDFAYMEKPVIFYQFDRNSFFEQHYRKGYFDYERDGFGPICEQEEDLVNKVEYYFENDFKLDDKYISRLDDFFELRDRNNCNRIFKAIKNLG